MKNKILSILLAAGLLGGTISCSDFGDTNVDPESLTKESMDMTLVFSNVVAYGIYGTEWEVWTNGLIYTACMMQHLSSVSWHQGDKYRFTQSYNQAFWERHYENSIRDAVDILYVWKDNDYYFAERQMVRIVKAYAFHRMTDLYGDVPYFEAGLGYHEGIGYPKYDKQQDIYMDMLNELKEAAEALSTVNTSKIGNADLLYQGDVTKWRKFAYSLMLRLGMRLSKVEPETAKAWVQTAINGGMFTSIEDDAVISHIGGQVNKDSGNPYGKILSQDDPGNFRMSEYFINLLKNTNDPRLVNISTLCEDPNAKYESGNLDYGDTNPAIQIGMPNGYDSGEDALRPISSAPNYPGSIDNYSVPNRYTFANHESPTLAITYAETQLLLAEAALRGWISGNAADYYKEGVRASMKQYAHYERATPIADEAIENYLASYPFDPAKGYEQINTQYYIITFCNEFEAFANWRRSGYPQLALSVTNYPLSLGSIPRRFVYNSSEATVNAENYKEAVSRLKGGDTMTSRVWWDVE